MSDQTTIRVNRATVERLRGYKPSPGTSDEWCLTWVLDKLEESDEEINALHNEVEKLKKEVS